MGKYFGTDGFRGEANVDLTVEHAYKVGRYLGYYFGKEKQGDDRARIVIGKDTRRSSYMFEYSLVAGLTASGADVYLMHVTPTPSVSYIVRADQFDCGIMISAQDGLHQQLQVLLTDLVGVVVVGVDGVAVYPLEGCQRCEYVNVFHGSAPP